MSDPGEVELQAVVSHHVEAGNLAISLAPKPLVICALYCTFHDSKIPEAMNQCACVVF